MAASTRRTLLAGLIGVWVAGALAGPARLRAASLAPALPLPEGTMRLERVLLRELGGGAAIAVRRGWDIAFARSARGVVISGSQIAVSVEAPPNLAELARIEEQRDTQAMFPILLSDTGLILASGSAPIAPTDIASALQAAERLIAERPQSEERRANVRRYLAEIHRAGSGQFEALPPDLFYPSGTPLRRIETVALPGGLTGTFELSWDARPAAKGGWLAAGERQIVTRIEGQERRSREVWTLAPA